VAAITEAEERQQATEQPVYWIERFQGAGDPRWVVCWQLLHIARVLWRILDKIDQIYMAQPEADDIRKAVAAGIRDSR
jgi:hypothetical protein